MLTAEQRRRYSRNILLDEIGKEGQQKLLDSRVLIVGCGALGSIASMYLAGSGVGHLTIVDYDTIDISNLQRQLSFTTDKLGEKKVKATAQRLREINPEIEITPLDLTLTRSCVKEILRGHDVVVEGSDNPYTKHMIALACRELQIPCVTGGVQGWNGQVTTSLPGKPGYLELFPEPAADDAFTPCSLGGLLGPLPGVIASMQAAEVIKLITGAGEPLSSRLLMYNGLTAETQIIRI